MGQIDNPDYLDDIKEENSIEDKKADRIYRAGFLAGWQKALEGDKASLRAVQNRPHQDQKKE